MSLTTNIYELGGDSLTILRIFSKIRETFNMQTTLDKFKNSETIVSQADVVDSYFETDRNVCNALLKVQRDYYQLTSAQKRMWLISKLENNSAMFNTLSAIRLIGELDTQRFRYALDKILETEPILRANFFEKDKVSREKPP